MLRPRGEELLTPGEELSLGEKLPTLREKLPRLGEKLPKLREKLPRLGEKLPKLGEKLPKLGGMLRLGKNMLIHREELDPVFSSFITRLDKINFHLHIDIDVILKIKT